MSASGLHVTGLKVNGSDASNATAEQPIPLQMLFRKYPPSVPHSVLFRTDLSTPSTTWDNVVENNTSAESQIRDTDMATEMVTSNNNILAQAGQAMLAQSNQANQGVLSLLQ